MDLCCICALMDFKLSVMLMSTYVMVMVIFELRVLVMVIF
jgi:hypothetical protein